ncbi:MAG: acetyl-CoA acetyltransferase [Pseudomonadota bacterium]
MTRTPVLVGVAQNEQRVTDWQDHKEPLALMIEASRAAAEDAGSTALLDAATSVRVIRGRWPYSNPAAQVAEGLGLGNVETCGSQFGGNFVQTLLNASALDIQAGNHDVILITGAECGATQAKARRAGDKVRWEDPGGTPDRVFGAEVPMAHPEEIACQIMAPIQMYPIFENALRHHLGEDQESHMQRVSELWAGFSAVAADNPSAWLREPKSAEEIRTVGGANRPVSLQYPKFMNSNNNVDQGAALILCSTDAARRFGIPEDRWVYPWAGTDGHDTYYVSNRDNLYSSPAIRFAAERCLELADLTPETLDHVDLYSCFPVAVQVAAREIGLDQSRPLTVTGGLTFAGGPLNNYVMHSIARTVELSRAQPGTRNLVTANGGYLTKHAFGIYSSEPPAAPFQHDDVQARIDAEPTREVVEGYAGPATIESYTVMYAGTEPQIGHLACTTPDGARAWGNATDPEIVGQLVSDSLHGQEVRISDRVISF